MNLNKNALRTRNVRLNDNRRAEISQLAESISELHFSSTQIDPRVLAERKRIPVAYNSYGDAFDGALEYSDGRFRMFVNLDRVESKGSSRSRFTMAHELGHYFIDEHRLALESGRAPGHRSRCEYENDAIIEQEADHFASCLLLPEGRFHSAAVKAQKNCNGWEVLKSLSTTFGTSWTSTAIRYASLDIQPCALIKWTRDGYGWKWLSKSFLVASLRKTIESSENVVVGGATQKALNGESPGECGYFRCGTVASAWFPFIDAGSTRDSILIEEAVPLGRFGVLTLLYPESGRF